MQGAQEYSNNITVPSLSSLLPPSKQTTATNTFTTIMTTTIVAIKNHTSKIIKLNDDITDSIRIIIVNSKKNVFTKQTAVIDLLTLIMKMLPTHTALTNIYI